MIEPSEKTEHSTRNKQTHFILSKFLSGYTAYRTDWGYGNDVFVSIEHCSVVGNNFFIHNTLRCRDNDIIGYGITYADLISNNWVYVKGVL